MKCTLLFLALAASLSGFAQVPGHVPADGLVVWYPFNGNALDESGNAANVTIHGATPTEDRNGVSSAALHFDGQSWVSASPLDLPNADAPRSVSAWLNPSTVAGPFTLTAVAYGAPSTSSAFMVGLYNQGIAVQGWADDFGAEVDYNADEWMHVVCTYAASSIKIYLNGVLIEEGENTSWNTLDGPLILGSRVDLENSYFEGSIDDVGIWNRALDPAEVVALCNGVTSVPGCTDSEACNFSEEANVDDGSCISCSVFAERCGEGTIWDGSTQTCVVANPSDTNFDGCVGMTDLLDLLSSFGTCVEVPWACGDSLGYQGYHYATVLIGEQCWFAENLRSESYSNGDVVISGQDENSWASLTEGGVGLYGDYTEDCTEYLPQGDGCDASENLSDFGRLYNWYAATDERGLCPSGWRVPSGEDFDVLFSTAQPSVNTPSNLMSQSGWYNDENGNNGLGFGAQPGGYITASGVYRNIGKGGYWWTSSNQILAGNKAPAPFISWNEGILYGEHFLNEGFSVRCIQDSE